MPAQIRPRSNDTKKKGSQPKPKNSATTAKKVATNNKNKVMTKRQTKKANASLENSDDSGGDDDDGDNLNDPSSPSNKNPKNELRDKAVEASYRDNAELHSDFRNIMKTQHSGFSNMRNLLSRDILQKLHSAALQLETLLCQSQNDSTPSSNNNKNDDIPPTAAAAFESSNKYLRHLQKNIADGDFTWAESENETCSSIFAPTTDSKDQRSKRYGIIFAGMALCVSEHKSTCGDDAQQQKQEEIRTSSVDFIKTHLLMKRNYMANFILKYSSKPVSVPLIDGALADAEPSQLRTMVQRIFASHPFLCRPNKIYSPVQKCKSAPRIKKQQNNNNDAENETNDGENNNQNNGEEVEEVCIPTEHYITAPPFLSSSTSIFTADRLDNIAEDRLVDLAKVLRNSYNLIVELYDALRRIENSYVRPFLTRYHKKLEEENNKKNGGAGNKKSHKKKKTKINDSDDEDDDRNNTSCNNNNNNPFSNRKDKLKWQITMLSTTIQELRLKIISDKQSANNIQNQTVADESVPLIRSTKETCFALYEQTEPVATKSSSKNRKFGPNLKGNHDDLNSLEENVQLYENQILDLEAERETLQDELDEIYELENYDDGLNDEDCLLSDDEEEDNNDDNNNNNNNMMMMTFGQNDRTLNISTTLQEVLDKTTQSSLAPGQATLLASALFGHYMQRCQEYPVATCPKRFKSRNEMIDTVKWAQWCVAKRMKVGCRNFMDRSDELEQQQSHGNSRQQRQQQQTDGNSDLLQEDDDDEFTSM